VVKYFSSKRRIVALAGIVLLALFVLRPGASRLKSRIITSISAAVGRPVDIGAVHIQILPRPAFDIDNLVIYDDPEFGAEPILRANEVMAALRLTSLLRGRLEISRLDMAEPSLNLVHNPTGRWNLEALLERSSQIPLAPTGKAKSEARPGFPYIEVSSGRINFKSGAEKRPYALTNADFSLWQDSENTWGVRLKAQPVRTDLNLSDSGQLQINGTWQRAQTFRDTPLQFTVEWSHAQLGQFTKLLSGNDKGWRGTIQVDAEMSGSPANLKISSSGWIDDFRRYDITSGKALRLGAHCDGRYSTVTHEFHEVLCSSPVGNGLITLTGDVGLPGSHRFAVMVRAVNVPAAAAMVLAARAKKNVPDDLETDGTLRGDVSMQEDAAASEPLHMKGGGVFSELRLASVANKADITLDSVPFSVTDGRREATVRREGNRRNRAELRVPPGAHLEIGPFETGAGKAHEETVYGWINRDGYRLALSGEIELARAVRLGRMIGLPVWASSPEGTAQADLQVAGTWSGLSDRASSGFVGPQLTGTAKLHNVKVVNRELGGPLEIVSAEVQLSPAQVKVSNLNAKAAGSVWTGSLQMPRGCGMSCPVNVALNTNEITLAQVGEWMDPSARKRPWYRVLDSSPQSGPSLGTTIHASGRLSADQLIVHGIAAKHASANIRLEDGKLRISDFSAEILGGKQQGEWTADLSEKQAVCKGSGKLSGVSLESAQSAVDERWIAGLANASYEITGKCFADFWKTADGTVQVDLRQGTFPRVIIGDSGDPLRVTRLSALANVHAGQLEVADAKLDSSEGTFTLSGTASWKREIDFKLTPVAGSESGGTSYAITGTLASPQVAPVVVPVQAKLKAPATGK
jgi:uncharacterized protein involved in outer membrane biogenesis